MDKLELRCLANAELRTLGDRKLVGYAAVFGQLSEDLGHFRENIRVGAFTRTLQAGADVRALVDHDPSRLIGRTKAGTLHLREDRHGLLTQIDLPDTSLGHDVYELIKRHDLTQMSFGFKVKQDAWPERALRELIDVDLFDVSVLTFPAYPQTEVSARGAVGSNPEIGWYSGGIVTIPPVIEPTAAEIERLKLKLRLAKQLN